MTQEQVQKQTRRERREATAAENEKKRVNTEKLKADLDAIIDDIDDVLTDAEADTLIAEFHQKSGQ